MQFFSYLPIDGSLSFPGEYSVGFREMAAAEKCSSRKGRGVCGLQYIMARAVDELAFGFGVIAPEEEDYAIAIVADTADYGIGESLPANIAVGGGF